MQGELDILEILLQSGIVVKFVLLLLIFASIASFAIVWKKFNDLKIVESENEEFVDIFRMAESLEDAHIKGKDYENSGHRIMFDKAYEELMKLQSASDGQDFKSLLENHIFKYGLSSFQRSLEQGISVADEELNKNLTTLASIGSITPFVGLFGTVWGIIDAFTGLAGASSSIDAVAPGIAEALVATAVGLFAAIPAVWFFNYFSSRNATIHADMESFSKEFLNTIERASY